MASAGVARTSMFASAHVRKLLGYVRYNSPAAVAAINDLYAELRQLQNLFLPSVKLVGDAAPRPWRVSDSGSVL